MALLGIRLTLLIGKSVPKFPKRNMTDAMQRVEVTQHNEGRTAFQITFKAGRDNVPSDYRLLRESPPKPFDRVILIAWYNLSQHILIDGIITDQQLTPSNEPGLSILTVTGEDLSVMMDLEEKIVEHPAQHEGMIATKIIAKYATYGLIPKVSLPPVIDVPLPTERIPVQHGTDLEYLREMADRYAYVFYVTPGSIPGTNTAYWGPSQRSSKRKGKPKEHPAFYFNMGPHTNVQSINFRYDALAAQTTYGRVQDRKTNQIKSVEESKSTRDSLSSKPALSSHSKTRRGWLRNVAGLTIPDARARAQARTDLSVDNVVTAEGELDVTRYGYILEGHGQVAVQGCGATYNGLYFVKEVTHIIEVDHSYKQRFILNREGINEPR